MYYRELYDFALSSYPHLKVPDSLVRPDCECPRPYMDTANLIRKQQTLEAVPDQLCYGAQNTAVPRYLGEYQGKWAIFSPGGWVSDYVDEAEIVLTLPGKMLVNAINKYCHFLDNELCFCQ